MYSTPPKILSKLPTSPSCNPGLGPDRTPRTRGEDRRKPLICKTLHAILPFVYPKFALFMLAKYNFGFRDDTPRKHPLSWRGSARWVGYSLDCGCLLACNGDGEPEAFWDRIGLKDLSVYY